MSMFHVAFVLGQPILPRCRAQSSGARPSSVVLSLGAKQCSRDFLYSLKGPLHMDSYVFLFLKASEVWAPFCRRFTMVL